MYYLYYPQEFEVVDGSTEFEYVAMEVVGCGKDYDCEIMYHSGKANVVADALSRQVVGGPIKDICWRMLITSSLLDLIRKDQVEALKKENWKVERIRGRIPSFFIDSWGLLT